MSSKIENISHFKAKVVEGQVAALIDQFRIFVEKPLLLEKWGRDPIEVAKLSQARDSMRQAEREIDSLVGRMSAAIRTIEEDETRQRVQQMVDVLDHLNTGVKGLLKELEQLRSGTG